MTTERVVIIAPHPDDESLGCGGTLLRHQAEGAELSWIIMTEMKESCGFPAANVKRRAEEIEAVGRAYAFARVEQLRYPAASLDTIPLAELVGRLAQIFSSVNPTIVYLPFGGDVHSDHRISFEVAVSCCKSFRSPTIRRVLAYETLSETDFGLDPKGRGFQPNVFVDITKFLEEKIKILGNYHSELASFPFPRSEKAIRSLAACRGVVAKVEAAEAFMLLREIR